MNDFIKELELAKTISLITDFVTIRPFARRNKATVTEF